VAACADVCAQVVLRDHSLVQLSEQESCTVCSQARQQLALPKVAMAQSSQVKYIKGYKFKQILICFIRSRAAVAETKLTVSLGDSSWGVNRTAAAQHGTLKLSRSDCFGVDRS
jgi:hypothetical protein